jgi:hypothetical protein
MRHGHREPKSPHKATKSSTFSHPRTSRVRPTLALVAIMSSGAGVHSGVSRDALDDHVVILGGLLFFLVDDHCGHAGSG